MNTLNLKPAPGLVIIDPVTRQRLPEEGDEVPHTTYWQRRLDDGDVLRVEPAKAEPKRKTKRAEASADDDTRSVP